MATSNSISFAVRRCEPEMVAPARATPHEFRQLSDIDHQLYLQFQSPQYSVYEHNPSMQGKDPVKVIKESIAQALVYYYPFAGRIRKGPDNKLIVDCTGEGVLFIEADADATVEQFGDPIPSPFPCFQELLYNVPGTEGILNTPLMLFQVTRLKCGGFVLGFRLNHPMSDALGIVQLLNAMGEIARGAQAPSVLPVWQRELLCARNPPRVTCRHHEYGNEAPVVVDPTSKVPEFHGEVHVVAHRTFVLNHKELSNIRRWIPSHLHPCSNFEVISACLWRCYAIASQANPNEEMRMQLLVNARSKFNPPLPKGYYGNVLALPVAVTNARKLCLNSLGYAMELIRNAKHRITEEYMRSLADLMEITKGQPIGLQSYVVSDLTSIGFDQVDYGWGNTIYTGPPKAMPDEISIAGTYFLPYRFKNGERGVMLLVSLRAPVMERFAILLEELARHDPERSQGQQEMILRSL
ncbi:hypothetical protein SADUNF_Sadunf16G0292500 [Salix dunnii]|uniref:Uncharacterized protein n=1 Tax=Salix dunnii TaxID=1413687 RepID=A0A835JEU9_9ROSI|nr:hypothetical protein SADUNF_Sadunf16G0292500 [Salix dunnii]